MPELSFSLAHSRCSLGYLLYFPPNNLPQSHFGLPRQNALISFFDAAEFERVAVPRQPALSLPALSIIEVSKGAKEFILSVGVYTERSRSEVK